jgi:hypothetical protein
MVDLSDLIVVYDDALDPEICDLLINQIYENIPKHERVENNYTPNFTQFNLTENCNHNETTKLVHNEVIKNAFKYKNEYYEFVDKRVFPDSHAFEQFRIKKYNPGGDDMFDTHVDVKDYQSARRFLSFLWYLNDVGEGGKTVFHGKTITPKTGRLVMFPPLWMFPHKGEPPLSGPKYILTGYLHYK